MAKQNWKPGNMLYPVPAVMVTTGDGNGIDDIITIAWTGTINSDPPIPAVMVSCQRPGEKPNIVTIAWAGTICSDPAMVSISVRPERYSYDIIKETGEFTINLVTEKLAFATDYCGVKSGRDVDKFKEMNLHACDGVNVSCPAIEESPVNVECKVKQVVELGSHHMFIAEVVGVQISDEYMDKTGKFNLNSTGLVAYSHGEYFALGDKLGKFGYSVRKK